MKRLQPLLLAEFKNKFTIPLAGRVTGILPFLPFSLNEQAVVGHKFVLELGQEVRQPVVLDESEDSALMGHIHLKVRRDASVCKHIAKFGYDSDTGARSLKKFVDLEIKAELVERYLDEEEEISEDQPFKTYTVDVQQEVIQVY
jgi:ATP-dependent Clp protease ATP-binding subunit ClpA